MKKELEPKDQNKKMIRHGIAAFLAFSVLVVGGLVIEDVKDSERIAGKENFLTSEHYTEFDVVDAVHTDRIYVSVLTDTDEVHDIFLIERADGTIQKVTVYDDHLNGKYMTSFE